EIDDEDLDQDRRVSDDLDVGADAPADRLRATPQGDRAQNTDHEADDCGDHRQQQRDRKTADELVLVAPYRAEIDRYHRRLASKAVLEGSKPRSRNRSAARIVGHDNVVMPR